MLLGEQRVIERGGVKGLERRVCTADRLLVDPFEPVVGIQGRDALEVLDSQPARAS